MDDAALGAIMRRLLDIENGHDPYWTVEQVGDGSWWLTVDGVVTITEDEAKQINSGEQA
jgi:hypothetical protein